MPGLVLRHWSKSYPAVARVPDFYRLPAVRADPPIMRPQAVSVAIRQRPLRPSTDRAWLTIRKRPLRVRPSGARRTGGCLARRSTGGIASSFHNFFAASGRKLSFFITNAFAFSTCRVHRELREESVCSPSNHLFRGAKERSKQDFCAEFRLACGCGASV